MAKIRGILFDLGNTLLDFGQVDTLYLFTRGARRAYRYLKQLGMPLPPFHRYHRRQLWAVRWRYLLSRITQREFNSLDALTGLSRGMGHRLSPQQAEEVAWLYYEPLSRCARLEEGLLQLLAEFRGRGLAMGIISNTFVPGPVLDRHLASLGLLEFFPTRVYSCDVRYRKPHSRIFHIALRELALAPRESLFVGDSLQADVAGACRVGMISVLKDASGMRRRRGVRPAHRIARLAELRGILARYEANDE